MCAMKSCFIGNEQTKPTATIIRFASIAWLRPFNKKKCGFVSVCTAIQIYIKSRYLSI